MITDLLKGRRLPGAMVNLAAAGAANATAVYTQSTFAQQLGTKKLRLKKVMWRANAMGVDTWLHIGTGVAGAFVDLIPPTRIFDNLDDTLTEAELPDVEANATITAYPDAIGAGSIDVGVEVEEIG